MLKVWHPFNNNLIHPIRPKMEKFYRRASSLRFGACLRKERMKERKGKKVGERNSSKS
jgi:hypothetical protein